MCLFKVWYRSSSSISAVSQVFPKLWPFIYQPMTGHGAMTSLLTSQFKKTIFFARMGTHLRARTSLSIIPAISVCLSVCMCVCLRLPFLDNPWSDLIETCQEYCWGPEDVPFQGLILIGQAVPKLWPFICFFKKFLHDWRHNSSSSSFDMTSQLTLGTWVCAFSRFDIVILHPFQLFPKCFPSYGHLFTKPMTGHVAA